MLMKRILLMVGTLMVGLSFAGKKVDNVVQLHEKQIKFIITVKVIPTTGYTWSVKKYDKKLFQFLSADYEKTTDSSSSSKMLGASLKQHFSFQLLKPLDRSANVTLRLARSWEPKDGQDTVFQIMPAQVETKMQVEKAPKPK